MLFSQKNKVYINTRALVTYSIIIFFHAILILFSFVYLKNCADFHIYCKMMGNWKKIKVTDQAKSKSIQWQLGIYEKNTIVKYKDNYYIGIEDKNASDPTDFISKILYVSF